MKPSSDLQVQHLGLDVLVPDPANPNTHDDRNLAAIRASLEQYGQVEPLVVQESTMMVVGGNGRLATMKAMGWATAACVVLPLDDTQARSLSIALNRTGELSQWDEGVLAQHLQALAADLDAFDPDALGFSDAEMARLVDALDYLPPGQVLDADLFTEDPSAASAATGFQGQRPTSRYMASNVKKFEIYCTLEQFPEVRRRLALVRDQAGVENNSDAVLYLLEQYEQEHDAIP